MGLLHPQLLSPRWGERQGEGGVPHNLENALKHSFEILQHVAVPESQHTNARSFERFRAADVASQVTRISVLAAIELDGEAGLLTIEVDDESADGMLAPELQLLDAPAAKRTPESGLGIRLSLAEAARAAGGDWVAMARHSERNCREGLSQTPSPYPSPPKSGAREPQALLTPPPKPSRLLHSLLLSPVGGRGKVSGGRPEDYCRPFTRYSSESSRE
jgi:hypothetical protein